MKERFARNFLFGRFGSLLVIAAWLMLFGGCASDPHITPKLNEPPITMTEGNVVIFGRFINRANYPKDLNTWTADLLELVRVPYDGEPLIDRLRKADGWLPLDNEVRAVHLRVRPSGFFYATIPPGQFMLRKLPERVPWLGFSAPEVLNAYYVGTITLDDGGVSSINWLRHLSVYNEFSEARQELSEVMPDVTDGQIQIALISRLPCTVNALAYHTTYGDAIIRKPGIARGKLVVAVARFHPQPLNILAPNVDMELVKRLSARGAKDAAVATFWGSLQATDGLPLLLLMPITVPIAAAAGAIVGAAQGADRSGGGGLPKLHAEELEKTLKNASENTPIPVSLVEKIVKVAQKSGIQAEVRVDVAPEEQDQLPTYKELQAENYSSVLELAILNSGFRIKDSSQGRMSFGFTLRLRTVSLLKDGDSASRILVFESPTHTYDEWIANSGQLLSEVLRDGTSKVGDCICEALFGFSE